MAADALFEMRAACSLCGAPIVVVVDLDPVELGGNIYGARPARRCEHTGCCAIVPYVEDRTIWTLAEAPARGSA